MRAPVVVYYMTLFAFAATLMYFFWSLGKAFEYRYAEVERARNLELQSRMIR